MSESGEATENLGLGPTDSAPRPGNVLVLPPSAERELAETDESLGTLGRPFDRRMPFFVGLTGTFGVAVAYVIVRGIADITTVLVVIGLALFSSGVFVAQAAATVQTARETG